MKRVRRIVFARAGKILFCLAALAILAGPLAAQTSPAPASPKTSSNVEDRLGSDFNKLEKQIAILFPGSEVHLIPAQERIVVKGQVKSSDEAKHIIEIVRSAVANSGRDGKKAGDADFVVNQLEIPGNPTETLIAPLPSARSREQVLIDVSLVIASPQALKTLLPPGTKGSDTPGKDDARSQIERPTEFAADIRQKFLTTLAKDGSSKIVATPTLTTSWGREASLLIENLHLGLRIKPTRLGKGQIALEMELGGDWPIPRRDAKWKITTSANQTIVLPIGEKPNGQLLALIQPQIIAVSPQTRAQPALARPENRYARIPVITQYGQVVGYAGEIPHVNPRSYQAGPIPASEEAVATLQMIVFGVKSEALRKVLDKTKTELTHSKDVPVQRTTKADSPPKTILKKEVTQSSFVLDAAAAKDLVTQLKLHDDSLKVISRPQIRTIVGQNTTLEVSGSQPKAGTGHFKLDVTPKRAAAGGKELIIETHLKLLGPGKTVPLEAWTSGIFMDVQTAMKCSPESSVGLVVEGRSDDRCLVLLTELVALEEVSIKPDAAAAPAPPAAAAYQPQPWAEYPVQRGLYPIYQPGIAAQRAAFVEWKAKWSPPGMRVVNLRAIAGSTVSPGDTVDVLLLYEDRETDEAKIKVLCESVKVFATNNGEEHSVSLLVAKEKVEELLLAEIQGELRLSLHRSSVTPKPMGYTSPGQPTLIQPMPGQPIYGRPGSPPGTPSIDYPLGQSSGSGLLPGIPATAAQPATLYEDPARAPRPTRVVRPKSEIQQVLEEVREMRKLIQGLREDVDSLRKAAVRVIPAKPAPMPKPATSSNPNSAGLQSLPVYRDQPKPVYRVQPSPVYTVPTPSLVKPVPQPRGAETSIRVREHHLHLLKRKKKFTRIAVGAPSIVDIAQYTPTELGISALKPGSTTVMIWYEDDGDPEQVTVEVVAAKVIAAQPPRGNEDPFSSTGSKEADNARRQIEEALKKKVSLDIADGTLTEALKQLHESAGVNIAIDTAALLDAGVTTDTKVSVHLNGVSLRSTLKLLLNPLYLTFVIEDEVLKVTNQIRAKGAQSVVAYQVKDLIATDVNGKADFDSIIELITRVVEPDSWQEVGGMGSVAANQPASSLVIRQTQDAHEEIQQLFTALRKWQTNVGHGEAEATRKPADPFDAYRPATKSLPTYRDANPSRRTGEIPAAGEEKGTARTAGEASADARRHHLRRVAQ